MTTFFCMGDMMKFFLLSTLIVFSFSANATHILDRKEHVKTVLDALKLLGNEIQIPSQVSTENDTGEGKFKPGTLVILNHLSIGQNHFECKILSYDPEAGSSYISQYAFMEKTGLNNDWCLHPNDPSDCFVSVIPLNMYNTNNYAFVAINISIPLGTTFQCRAKEDASKHFEAVVL